MSIIEDIYLECTTENHHKYYRVMIDVDYNRYKVLTVWGRIGQVKEPVIVYETSNRTIATTKLNEIINSKLAKGYVKTTKNAAEVLLLAKQLLKPDLVNISLDRFANLED